MYLTRIALDMKRRETMRALSSPGILHGAVEHCFDGARARSLWRTDIPLLPAYAWVILQNRRRPVNSQTAPCVCGGDPSFTMPSAPSSACSPRMRG